MKEAQKQKQLIIDEIKDKFERAESAVVIDYIGITVAQADAMRKKLREAVFRSGTIGSKAVDEEAESVYSNSQ